MISKYPTDRVEHAFRDERIIGDALRDGIASAFQRHSWSGVPMAIWKDGRVVLVDPNAPSTDIPKDFAPPRSHAPDWNRL